MEIAPEKDRNKAFTIQTALVALTAFLGSIAAGILPESLMRLFPGLSEAGAFNSVLWLGVPAYLISVLLLLKTHALPTTVQEAKHALHGAAPLGLLIFLGVLFGLQIGSENAVGWFMNVYLAGDLKISNMQIGFIFAGARLLPFFFSPLQPLALNRWGSGKTMTFAYIILAACALLIAFFPSVGTAATGFILFSLAASFTSTARTLFGQELVQPRWRTAVAAVLTVSLAAGGSLAGFGAARLIPAAGFRGLFLGSAVLSLLIILLYAARWFRIGRQAAAVQPEVTL
jgi:MFS family permease